MIRAAIAAGQQNSSKDPGIAICHSAQPIRIAAQQNAAGQFCEGEEKE